MRKVVFSLAVEKNGIELSEKTLEARTQLTTSEEEFWSAIVHSALSFVDVYYFHLWMESYHDPKEREKVVQAHVGLRMLMLNVLATAAWSNKLLEKEEKEFLQYYLTTAQLPEEQYQQGEQLITERVSLDNIEWSEAKSPIIKRYLLELATMIILSDKVLTESEQSFLDQLRIKMKVPEKDAQYSMLAVESFVIEHWQNISFLHQNKDVEAMMMYVLEKLKTYFVEQLPQLQKYVDENPGLKDLLHRSQTETISTDDRKKIRQGLMDALQTTPAYQSSVVPRSLLTYSVIIDLTPKALLSSHQSQEL